MLIRYTRDGKPRRGSGLRVGGRFVLTADHCANGSGHQLVVDGREYPATVHLRSDTDTVDVAILLGEGLPEMDALDCALVNRDVDDDLEKCRALGFPTWKKNPQAHATDDPVLARTRGTVPTAEGIDPFKRSVELLTFKITDPAAGGRPVPAGELDKSSIWAGMSGAGVVTDDDLLIGVIRSHNLTEGGLSLTVTPLYAISKLPDAVTAAGLWAALGVADPTVLPRVPLPREITDRPHIAAAQVVIGTIPREPLGFVTRDTVHRLGGVLDEGRAAVVCAMTGLRGVGKTQVAAAYARQRITDGWSLVAWVNADTADRMLSDLAAIARELQVHDPDGDSAVSAQRLTQHLITRTGPGLMVFDNATDPDLLRRYLPPAGPIRIVITSTDQSFTELATEVPVDTYTRTESQAYLSDRTRLDDDSGADRVAAELGDHPLALAQAAAAIRRGHWTFQTYLDHLSDTPITELLQRLPGQDYPLATASALLIGITQLENDDRTGHTSLVLRLLAVLSPDGVPRKLVESVTDRADLNGIDLDELLERCEAGSVISWSVRGEAVLMHRLLARVLRERDQLTGRFDDTIRLAAALLRHQLVPEESAWERRADATLLIDQIEAVWSALHEEAASGSDVVTELLQQRLWAVRQLTAAADLQRAIDLGETVMRDCNRILGTDHLDTLTSRNDLALAYDEAGRIEQAIPLLEAVCRDIERVRGADHPDSLDSTNNLAYVYESAGQLEAAIPLYEKVLADSLRLLGPEHPDTLTSRSNLANAEEAIGRRAKALAMKEQVLADRERILGPDHPDTLTSRNNLAQAYRLADRIDEAVSLYQRTLADRQRILGPDHPDTLDSQNNLAMAYRLAGQLDEAISLYEQTLADRQRILGADNPDTLISQNNLAFAYRTAGMLDKAVPLSELALTRAEVVLGPDNPTTITSRSNVGLAYRAAGRLAESIPFLERAFNDRQRVLGADNPATVTSRDNLARTYQEAGRVNDALSVESMAPEKLS
ncbi:MAG: tetratricopeptide repeat protein [Nakamurella sp.]